MTLELTIRRVGVEHQPLLHNLAQLYVHDMSEWFDNDVLADGSYAYDVGRWWAQAHLVYLASANTTPLGFAVVGSAQQWTGHAASRDVAEFFVLRKYRHAGAGAMLASFLWAQHPGEWLVRVLETNLPAVPFWRKVVTGRVGERHQEQQVLIGERRWRHFRFNSGHAT